MKNINFKNVYKWPLAIRVLMISMACLLTFYLGYRWDILNLNEQLVVAQQQETDLKQQLQLIITKQALIQADIKEYSKANLLFDKWKTQLINHIELPSLFNQILKIGNINQLYFDLFEPGAKVKEEGYLKVPIKIVVVGSYHQLAAFVSQVANMPLIVVIGDFLFVTHGKSVPGGNSVGQGNSDNLLSATLFFDVYTLDEKNTHAK